jgi:cysteine desulfuration protein SufE
VEMQGPRLRLISRASAATWAPMTAPATFEDFAADYELLDDKEERWRLLIDLGRALEPMPDALKTDATKVRGCSASVWVYPTEKPDGRLHFFADSDAAITKGIVALILLLVQDRAPQEIVGEDIPARLAPLELSRHLSSNRTQGIPNMIELVQQTARRLAA